MNHLSIALWRYSDFAILELEERIPESYNVFLSGWSADEDMKPVNPVGIHHPSADIKKISFFKVKFLIYLYII